MSVTNADLDRQIEQLKRCECIKESEVRDLCNKARDILLEESNIQNIFSPITVSILVRDYRSAETSTANSMI
jgi:serine/threonine-protein phosphatase 4 catalytic subunit